jgi:hypothetical protein
MNYFTPALMFPVTIPAAVPVAATRTVRHALRPISGIPRVAQSATHSVLAVGTLNWNFLAVQVTPKLPAVPVVAESVTVLIPLMLRFALDGGMRYILSAGTLTGSATTTFPVELSL